MIDLTEDGQSEEKRIRSGRRNEILSDPNDNHGWAILGQNRAQFLKLVNDPANQPVFVHCQGGRHRTGVMTAVYRMTRDGWNPEQAYQEMKQYNFEGFPGHPVFKELRLRLLTHIEDSPVTNRPAFESKSNPKVAVETATK